MTQGQIEFEFEHLRRKLEIRDPAAAARLKQINGPLPLHPLFTAVPGPVEVWEKDARAEKRLPGTMD
ncbi:hypothetical protein [Glutamicibacter arilaitensis]|uniref:hypothetical protein n=1 Tax=Glutamicibacter arilaitensis TaxID=256701 RepID=UPI003A8D3585